ncbi:transposase family protein [Nocardiopsis metallicus]|uniref:Transposase IS204/IS1001/IS1096/IS1165 zinc-finger domain-containing protein n=1 Tax=Nocardiopsis metallicus TaxID=179819 RepID=A0A840VZ43_9ACTN|nr:transposase family protein [Nocardiopsis metallicus]MBB5489770.1 hypothetical protein [Nocardiopsis metallicus]
MSLSSLFDLFFPHLTGLDIHEAHRHGRTVHITGATTSRAARRPACQHTARRVHSRSERRLADTPASGQEILTHLRARRFFCAHPLRTDDLRRTTPTPDPPLRPPHPAPAPTAHPPGMALGGRARRPRRP